MTLKQARLKRAIEARGSWLEASWQDDTLFVEGTIRNGQTGKKLRKEQVYLTFDMVEDCYGAKVTKVTTGSDYVARIALYEALRIGHPETLDHHIAECADAGEWDGSPRTGPLEA